MQLVQNIRETRPGGRTLDFPDQVLPQPTLPGPAHKALFPAVNAKGDDWEVAVTGVSCRQQVEQGTGRKARHVVEILRDALG